jgi:hypothetical protein
MAKKSKVSAKTTDLKPKANPKGGARVKIVKG